MGTAHRFVWQPPAISIPKAAFEWRVSSPGPEVDRGHALTEGHGGSVLTEWTGTKHRRAPKKRRAVRITGAALWRGRGSGYWGVCFLMMWRVAVPTPMLVRVGCRSAQFR